jgi:peptidoglycan/LPS O-acetylase OafA/YrhL
MRGANSADSHVIQYRSDVDGLRAVAVLSVVLFHLFKTALRGGYLGVDMFFVISGYLISAIIWREAETGQFSAVRFYDRRIRRIMPALLVLLLATTVASAVLLLPSDLLNYAKSLLATLIFAANVYFWRDTDYFSPAAEQKPLLHLWSLGVEEQFYILFPLLLLGLARYAPRRALPAIVLLTGGSLALNIGALFIGGATPAFFLLPTRAWELGLGAILALLPLRFAPRPAAANCASWTGALSVLLAIAAPVESFWWFPAALPAALGTALLIWGGTRESPAPNRALRLPPIVFLGLISYSLYLWHWPIIVLSQYYLVHPLSIAGKAAAFGSMAACATLSWRLVERPSRDRRVSIRRVRSYAALGACVLVAAAAGLLWSKGLPRRLSAAASQINRAVDTNYRCPVSDYLALGRSRACVMNLASRNPADADVVLLGNSHAQMYAPIWTSILEQRGLNGLLVPANGCLPTVGVNISTDCLATARANLAQILGLSRAKTVIIGLTWDHGRDGLVDASGTSASNPNDQALVSALDGLMDTLIRGGKSIVLIGPIAEPGWDVASIMSRDLAFGRPVERPTFMAKASFMARFGSVIAHFQARRDIRFARPDRVQCPDDRCYYVIDGRSLFSDSNHLARDELQRFRAIFEDGLPGEPQTRTENGKSPDGQQ